jgi:hypothetical protein
MQEDAISWGELAELTHATQMERFNFCGCEDNEGTKILMTTAQRREKTNVKICSAMRSNARR